MGDMKSAEILVVGAGPTGLTVAVELARRGVIPRVIDCKAGPTPLSKAVGISPMTLDLLEPSGITARLLAQGIRVRTAGIHFDGSELGVIDFRVLQHRFDFLLSLPQSETESIMASVLEGLGGHIEWRTRFVGLDAKPGAIEVQLEGPRGQELIRCSQVFGADGAESVVRASIGVGFEGYDHARKWSIADIEVSSWPYEPQAAQLFLHPGGDVGFVIPIGVNRFRAVSNTEDAMARIPGSWRIARTLRSDTFHIPIRQATTYQRGNVFIGGDAAHAHSPVGARGMNLGIEDAASFVRHHEKSTLDHYTSERHPVGERWIGLSERILRMAQTRGPTKTALRNLALRIAGHVPPLQKPALQRVAGLRE